MKGDAQAAGALHGKDKEKSKKRKSTVDDTQDDAGPSTKLAKTSRHALMPLHCWRLIVIVAAWNYHAQYTAGECGLQDIDVQPTLYRVLLCAVAPSGSTGAA